MGACAMTCPSSVSKFPGKHDYRREGEAYRCQYCGATRRFKLGRMPNIAVTPRELGQTWR